jgi:hypothetical protein
MKDKLISAAVRLALAAVFTLACALVIGFVWALI